MMVRLRASFCVLAVACATGCTPPVDNSNRVLPPCADPRYTSGEYDAGATLDLNSWVLISGCCLPAELTLFDLPAQSMRAFYRIGTTSGLVNVSIRADGVAAIATDSGFLSLAQLAAPGASDSVAEIQPFMVQQLQAAGVAWSNDGQRLALIGRTDAGGLQLLLLDGQLDVLSTTAIELKQAENGNTPYVVSWSPDDAQLALSTHIFLDFVVVNADCLLVELASGAQHRLPLANVHFVGANLIVGTEQIVERTGVYDIERPNLGPVYQMQLASGEVASRALVPDAIYAAASDPLRNTFTSVEVAWCWWSSDFGTIPALDARLRDTEGHFSVLLTELYGWTWGPYVLLAAESVSKWPAGERPGLTTWSR
jgi:hypothetical protein